MCLIAFAHRVDPDYPLVLVGNRDEFYARPALALRHWEGQLSGQDELAGGTWMSVAPGGRFAAVTNVRDPDAQEGALSRGDLPLAVTTSRAPLGDVIDEVTADFGRYGPANLLAGDAEDLWWATNDGVRPGGRRAEPRPVTPGVHGLSNAALDTPWPKLVGATGELESVLESGRWKEPGAGPGRGQAESRADAVVADGDQDISWAEPLLAIGANRWPAAPWKMPRTGVPLWAEWKLSARFVRLGRDYGTRCTTALRVGADGSVEMVERSFDPRGRATGTISARF